MAFNQYDSPNSGTNAPTMPIAVISKSPPLIRFTHSEIAPIIKIATETVLRNFPIAEPSFPLFAEQSM